MNNNSKLFDSDDDLLQIAAEHNYADALLLLAFKCESNSVDNGAMSETLKYAMLAAEAGSLWAMYVVARFLSNSDDENIARQAFSWAERAANKQFPPAEFLLAQFFEAGLGNAKDLNKAESLYKRAAKAGVYQAAAYLSHAYSEGSLGKRDPTIATDYAKDAAKAGDPIAATFLADCYLNGIGFDADPNEAIKWYELAASLGNKMASLKLAMLYAKGLNGIPVNKEKSQYYSNLVEQ